MFVVGFCVTFFGFRHMTASPDCTEEQAMTRTTPPPAAKPLSDSSTSEEESTDEELVHTPAPREQTFPQRVNEPLKIDRQQILEIANSRYVPKRLADGTAMLCEVSGAANSMMRRWESVFREYAVRSWSQDSAEFRSGLK